VLECAPRLLFAQESEPTLDTKVIIITGNGNRTNAMAAVERGAFDNHLKPRPIVVE